MKDIDKLNMIIEKYNKAMQAYCDAVFPQFYVRIANSKKPYTRFLKRLFDFYLFGAYLVDNGLFKQASSSDLPLKTLFAKASVAYFSIHNILRLGCVSEACVITRSLFEVLVNLKLMLQTDTEVRLQLFADYRFVSKWLFVNANPEKFTDNEKKIANDKYTKVKKNYHPRRPYHWAWKIFAKQLSQRNPSLQYICGKIGMGDQYKNMYATLSIAVHSDPHLDNLLKLGDKMVVGPVFSPLIFNIGYLSTFFYENIISLIVKYYSYADPDEIKMYTASFLIDLNESYVKKAIAGN